MFLADVTLTIFTLVLIAIVAVVVRSLPNEPLWGGALLILGCLAIIAGAAISEARRWKSVGTSEV